MSVSHETILKLSGVQTFASHSEQAREKNEKNYEAREKNKKIRSKAMGMARINGMYRRVSETALAIIKKLHIQEQHIQEHGL